MTHERNAEGLRRKAQEKKQQALSRTNQAINRLVKSGNKINFHTVAEAAGVSVPYLYKQDAIKERIDRLRKQQSPIKGLPQKETVSDDSKKAIVITLKKRVRDLEAETRGLRDDIEVIQGIVLSVSDLKQQLKVLEEENSKLREQLNKCRCQSELQFTSTPSVNSKITSLNDKKAKRSGMSDKIKLELNSLKIDLNTSLTKTIKSAPSEEIVLSAIEALKQAIVNGNVENPGGWLNKAIKDGWMPNENNLPQDKVKRDNFNEWFNLAYKQQLVLASTKGEDGQLYIYTREGVSLPFEQMMTEYPLESLRSSY